MQVYLASGAVAASLPLLLWSVAGQRMTQRSGKIKKKELQAEQAQALTDLRELVLQRSARERVVRPSVEALANRARRLTPAGMITGLERRIDLAGAAADWPLERVLALKMLLGAGGAALGLLRLFMVPSGASFVALLILTAIGYFGPDALLYHKMSSRQEMIAKELADTLDQITISVEAGLAFEPAMARAARGRKGPLADELSRTLQDIQLGVPRAVALKNLVARTDVPDLRTFVHAIAQAEKYGVPIARILRVKSSELRSKRRQAAEERAMKIPVKIVIPLIFCILPALFIVLMGPAGIRIANTGFSGG